MPSDAGAGPGAAQRLHPASLLFGLASTARAFLVPGILVLVASRGSNYELWFMVLFLPAAVGAMVKYATYRYRFARDELIIREGVVSRNERHIPYARIQNIDTVRNPFHRLFSVAEVRLETASGGTPEATIKVLSMRAVEELRAEVFRTRREAPQAGEPAPTAPAFPAAETPARTLLRMGVGDLMLFGLISNRGMAVIAAGLGLLWQLDVLRFDDGRIDGLPASVVQLTDTLPVPGPAWTVALAVASIVALLAVLRVLAAAWSVVKFHGFTLSRRGEDVTTEYGLLTRVSATVPRHRIQLLSVRAGPVHRWCRRAVVQVETAGGGQDGEGAARNKLWLAPLMPENEVDAMLEAVLPEAVMRDADWQPVSRKARRRLTARTLGIVVVSTAAAVGFLGPWALLLLVPGAGLVYAHPKMWVRHAAWALTPTAVLYRSGWWVRRISAVRFNKIQVLSVHESPFDRRHRMASCRVDTAGAGRVGHRVHVGYLDAVTAQWMVRRLALEADSTAFRW